MPNYFSTEPIYFKQKERKNPNNIYNQLYVKIVEQANDFVTKSRRLKSIKNPEFKIKKLKKFSADDAILIKQKIKRLNKKELNISVEALRSLSNKAEKIFEGQLSYTFHNKKA